MTDIALFLIATPIGHSDDLSPRATKLLLDAKLVIGEEFRPLTTLLKRLGRARLPAAAGQAPDLEVLNEHSKLEDVKYLADRVLEIHRAGGFTALVSDCGTPGFCDPGSTLVAELRARGHRSSAVPGASSLMCLLSLAGERLDEFVFRGFLPADRHERDMALASLAKETRAVVVMDTPYRLEKLLSELAVQMPTREALLACDLTTDSETLFAGPLTTLARDWGHRSADQKKAEFVLLIKASPRKADQSKNSRTENESRSAVKSRMQPNQKQTFSRKK
jgi:16S rRNA (cytidine1402-2'-O)-methyltransferase